MSIFRKINRNAREVSNTGFGSIAGSYGGRFINKDGLPNVKKTGMGVLERYSWFHSMLSMSRTHFFLTILAFFIIVNLFFASIYYFLGTEYLAGMNASTEAEKFGEAFFFSTQTFTTVGYGRISPTGFLTSAISSVQALMGLLSFAVATGLMYGRFSQPKAYIRFSDHAVIAPYKSGIALMFRLAPYKNTIHTDAECRLTLGMQLEENGKTTNNFFSLDLEIDKINALTLSWTLVHPITENSPLFNLKEEDYGKITGELIVFVKAFDDMFSNTVVTRTSYSFREIIHGARFLPMFSRNPAHNVTVLDLSKLNHYEKVALPV